MNPVGIEFLATVSEVAESSSTSPALQETGKGEFLSQFLGMLFADPPVDVESNGQPSSASEDEKESAFFSADTGEGSTGVFEGGDPRKFEMESENLPKVAAPSEDPVWVAPTAGNEVATTDKGGEATLSSSREDASPRQEKQTNGDSIALQKERESLPLRPSETDQNYKARVLAAVEKQGAALNSARVTLELSDAPESSENRESKVRAAVMERPRPEGSVSEVKTPDRAGDPARTGFELGNPGGRQHVAAPLDPAPSPSILPEQKPLPVAAPGQDTSLPASQGQDRLPVAAPPETSSPSILPEQKPLPVGAPGQDTSLSASQGQDRLPVAAPQETSSPSILPEQKPLPVGAPGEDTSPPAARGQDRLPVAAPGQDTSPPAARGQDRLPITPPAWVPELQGLVRETRGISVEAGKIEVDVTKPPTAAADLGAQMQQNGTRNQPETDYETQEEQLLRRLAVSRNSGQVEEKKTLAREAEPVVRFQVEPERSVNGTSKPAIPEAAQPSETPTTARPDAGALQGNPRLTLHEPQLAKEMVNLHRAEDFDRIADQIVKRMSLSQKGETFQLAVRLKPEFLGEVRIETVMNADRTIRAVIHAEDPSVKALLEGKVSSLVQRFDELGIHIDKVEVQTLLTDVGSGNDTSKERQGLGHSDHEKSSQRVASEPGDGLEEDSEEEIDDGHIHLFI